MMLVWGLFAALTAAMGGVTVLTGALVITRRRLRVARGNLEVERESTKRWRDRYLQGRSGMRSDPLDVRVYNRADIDEIRQRWEHFGWQDDDNQSGFGG